MPIEEEDGEGEAHAEAVHAAAAGKNEARTGLIEVEQGKPQEAGQGAICDGKQSITMSAEWQPGEAAGTELGACHAA